MIGKIESNPLNELLKKSQDVLIGRELLVPSHGRDHQEGTAPGDDHDEESAEEDVSALKSTYDGDSCTTNTAQSHHSADAGSTLPTTQNNVPVSSSSIVSANNSVSALEMISMEVYLKGMMVTYYNNANQIYKIEFHYFVPTNAAAPASQAPSSASSLAPSLASSITHTISSSSSTAASSATVGTPDTNQNRLA